MRMKKLTKLDIKERKKKKLLKMKELSEITEVNSGTIRYYINQGLLPQPYKPHKNMAYYDEGYIEKIQLIKNLQQNHFLPLEVIKMIIDETDYDLNKVKHFLKNIEEVPWFEPKVEKNGKDFMTKEEIINEFDVNARDFEAAVTYNMIAPDNNGLYDKENIKLVRLASQFRKLGLTTERGFTMEFLLLHAELIEFMARKEIDVFVKNILHSDITFDEVYDLSEKALEIIYQIAPIVHRRFLRKFLNEIRKKQENAS